MRTTAQDARLLRARMVGVAISGQTALGRSRGSTFHVCVCLSVRPSTGCVVCLSDRALAVSASRVLHRPSVGLVLVALTLRYDPDLSRRAATHCSVLWLPLREFSISKLAELVARRGTSKCQRRLQRRQQRDSRYHSSGPTRSVPNFIVVIAGVLRGRADSRHHLRCRRDVPIVHRCTLGVHFLQRQRHCRIHRHDALGARLRVRILR